MTDSYQTRQYSLFTNAPSGSIMKSPRSSTRPIGIDLFAGAGGLSLGFEQAGFDVVAAIELDPVHCAVHKFNFPHTAVISASVEQLTGSDIRLASGIGDSEVDCVFGGAPCQGFSLIGQRNLEDPRNRLVLDFVRIVTELNARTFVFENVKGLTVGRHKQFLADLVDAFDRCGYDVRLPWRVLNAGHYGTPQFRERLILMGARRGERVPQYPVPTTNIAGRNHELAELPIGPTCIDAIGDLPDADRYNSLLETDAVTADFSRPSSAFAAELRCLTNDAWHYGYPRVWNPEILTSSARTVHTDISRRRFSETMEGTVEPISRFFKLHRYGVSNTLRAGTDGARGAFTSPRPIHFEYPRCITVREMARLHGFPDWFRLNGTKWHGARQIGNAVPPPLARAIATSVRFALGCIPSRSANTIELGNPRILMANMAGAARHFGVAGIPGRRDKKSGAKKRKQMDIERERLETQ